MLLLMEDIYTDYIARFVYLKILYKTFQIYKVDSAFIIHSFKVTKIYTVPVKIFTYIPTKMFTTERLLVFLFWYKILYRL